ncbi:MAG TPA: hemerythrin domain-containing protein, partial [Nannocystaceae bacterium]|nr:hemerythrin domain-containing protein [Nannocystaceae bacterium]
MASIYEILEHEHGMVDHLLGELHDTDVAEAKRRTALVAQLVEELAALSRAEQEIVYPVLDGDPAEMRLVLADHGAIEAAMRDLVACDVHDEMWIAKLEVLRECVDHHIERDEGEV